VVAECASELEKRNRAKALLNQVEGRPTGELGGIEKILPVLRDDLIANLVDSHLGKIPGFRASPLGLCRHSGKYGIGGAARAEALGAESSPLRRKGPLDGILPLAFVCPSGLLDLLDLRAGLSLLSRTRKLCLLVLVRHLLFALRRLGAQLHHAHCRRRHETTH
jgi:hypothetical protein